MAYRVREAPGPRLPIIHPYVDPICVPCGMYKTSKAVCVPGEGNPDATIVVIGEGLGEEEEETHRPFQGRAGWILNRAILEAGLLRSNLWITNSVRCRPLNATGQNRPPTTDELSHCRTWLDRELQTLPNRRVLVALGASAAWACLSPHVPAGGVLENQGKTFWSERYQSWVVNTIHPAWALRKAGEALWLTLDLKKAEQIALTGAPATPRKPTYRVVRTLQDALEMEQALLRAPYLVWDWETGPGPRSDAVHPIYAQGFCVSFSGAAHEAWVVPRFGSHFTPLWSRSDLDQLDDILRHVFLSAVPKIGHNVAFDYIMTLSTLRVRPVNVVGCTMLAHHLLFNHLSERAHGLKRMSDMYSPYGRYDDPLDTWLLANGHSKKGKPDGAFIYQAPDEMIWEYNACDSIVPWLLHPMLEAKLREANLWSVYTEERIPLALEYAEMDRHGIPMSADRLRSLSKDLTTSMTAVRESLRGSALVSQCKVHGKLLFSPCGCLTKDQRDAGKRGPASIPEPLNPNSNVQVAHYMYSILNLPILARTETGQPSTREEVLKEYAPIVPSINLVLHGRSYSKLKGTYVDGKEGKGGLLMAIDPDGYARPHTLLHVVETLRLATRKPVPIHLIPRPLVLWSCPLHGRYQFTRCCETAAQESLNIRGIVRPPDGWRLVAGDYVQQEYALAGIASGQRDLEEAMLDRREDAHEYVMGILSGRSKREFQVVDSVTGQLRWINKTAEDQYKNLRAFFKSVNFMILYRGGAPHLARSLDISEDEAERQIFEYYERLPQIKWWQYRVIKSLRETGRVVGLFDTYRWLANVWSPYPRDRNEAERQACNFPFQNGGYHVMARSMLRLARRWRAEKFPGRILFSVHDELLAMVREDVVQDGMESMREEMERPHPQLVGGCGIPRGILTDIHALEEWGGEEWVGWRQQAA